jgi:hypothetical protein
LFGEIEKHKDRHRVDDKILGSSRKKSEEYSQGRKQKQRSTDQDHSLFGFFHGPPDHIDHPVNKKADNGDVENQQHKPYYHHTELFL